MLPEVFVGVWVRESIAVDGGEPCEAEDVVWIQGLASFADLRTPRGAAQTPVEAFGGTTCWDGKVLRWDHELDWHGAFADTDHGRIEWVDDVMVERGTMAVTSNDGDLQQMDYEEIWRREATAGSLLAMGSDTPGHRALHVAVADWSLTLATAGPGTFAARLVRPDGPTVVVGDGGLEVPDPDDLTWCWTVRDVPVDDVTELGGMRP